MNVSLVLTQFFDRAVPCMKAKRRWFVPNEKLHTDNEMST
jgi:hypothetical protein